MDSCDSLCFMVANSQEEDSQVIDDPIKMLHKLPALNQSSTQKVRLQSKPDQMKTRQLNYACDRPYKACRDLEGPTFPVL